jgi:hypothetical protein
LKLKSANNGKFAAYDPPCYLDDGDYASFLALVCCKMQGQNLLARLAIVALDGCII